MTAAAQVVSLSHITKQLPTKESVFAEIKTELTALKLTISSLVHTRVGFSASKAIDALIISIEQLKNSKGISTTLQSNTETRNNLGLLNEKIILLGLTRSGFSARKSVDVLSRRIELIL